MSDFIDTLLVLFFLLFLASLFTTITFGIIFLLGVYDD
jgi:hypothetical protein